MKNINNFNLYKKRNIDGTVKKSYMMALEDPNFVKLVNRLDVSEEVLIKYTSKLENTVCELNNCKGCKGLSYCKNRVKGYVNYPEKEEYGLVFNYIPCKYEKETSKERAKTSFFEMPKFLKEASMADIMPEKERLPIIKYLKEYITNFNTDKKGKGLYLCGSFGSGKSYLLSAAINEISKNNVRCVIVYYPTLLSTLKASFNTEDYDLKMDEIKSCDVLLLDDIGAENNTSWSRDEVLGTILQYRMDNSLATFFTSNLTIEELETHLKSTSTSTDAVKSRRIIERIKQLTVQMELVSQNKRK